MNSKQVKWSVLAVVIVLVAVVGVLVARNGAKDSASDGSTVTVTVTVPPSDSSGGQSGTTSAPTTGSRTEDPSTVSSSAPSGVTTPDSGSGAGSPASESSSPTGGSPGRPATNVPMKKLAPGEKPPQFVLFSFDGAGSAVKMREFLAAAADGNARFTAFLSGVYLIDDSHADAYQAPGARRGSSQVGFGGDAAEVIGRVQGLNDAYAAGNEIGTHYNGHFCELGGNWSTAQWNSELDQFFDFLANWKKIDNLPDAPDLQVPIDEVKGGRTPCLNHTYSQVNPAWKTHAMTYDSSQPAPRDGIFWPDVKDGTWEFYMPQVYSAGLGGKVTAMDYNFWVKFNGGKEDPSSASGLTPIVLDTYRYMYNQAFNGNRAPVLIANHFNNWNGNSFNPATIQFMRETCVKPDTYCATYQDVIAWMELQDPTVLAGLQARPSVAYQP